MDKPSLIMLNFSIVHKIDTQKTAVRFEGAASLHSEMTNSALHNGYSWAMSIRSSKNILIKNNVMFNFRPLGIVIGSSHNITLDGNVVGHIVQRSTLEALDMVVDVEGGIISCTMYSEEEKCKDITIENNIVAGAFWVGYNVYGHECGGTPKNTGNVAHSINSNRGGVGFMIVPD